MTDHELREKALEYHNKYPKGKVSIKHKPCDNQELLLAYTPGVAQVCKEIADNPESIYDYTNKGNMVAVISNGTAVLGLGDIGAGAGKPVMEGKALLFKKLAGVDAVDICLDEKNVDKLYNAIQAMHVSFGAINLEDIKAPECFELLERLQKTLPIPVFHDDQDGTAVVVCIAILNALKLTGRDIADIKMVCSGAGAAMIATLRLLKTFGLKPEQVTLFDSKGVVHQGRTDINTYKAEYATWVNVSMSEALNGADVFIGLSGPDVLKGEDIKDMAAQPIMLCLANPIPEIYPEEIYAVRKDVIVATGSSKYPNQVNNALCFPYLFRAVLDAGVKTITTELLSAFVHCVSEMMLKDSEFGVQKIMPNLLDPYLPYIIVPALLDYLNVSTNRMSLYVNKNPQAPWGKLLEQKSVNHINTDRVWLQDIVKQCSVSSHVSYQLESMQDIDGELYVFICGDEYVVVSNSKCNIELHQYPLVKKQDITDIGECIGVIKDKICYVSENAEHALFMVVFTSKLLIQN